jgi:hypothetical protein
MKMGQTLGLSMNLHYPFSLYSVSTKWYKRKTLINTHHADKKKRLKKKKEYIITQREKEGQELDTQGALFILYTCTNK